MIKQVSVIFCHSKSDTPTMRAVFVFVCLSVFVFLGTKAQHTPRSQSRSSSFNLLLSPAHLLILFWLLSVFGNLFGGGGGLFSPCTGCPIRKCLNDKAVILGYCCGCARVSGTKHSILSVFIVILSSFLLLYFSLI